MDYPLSNVDLNNYIKEVEKSGVNIFQMNDLTETTPLDHIFNKGGHCVFFYENEGSRIGHWISSLRDPEGNVYFLDSYGSSPEKYNSKLMDCFKNGGAKAVHINKKKLQGDSMTCGRYSIIFTCLHKAGIKPNDMVNYLVEGGKKYKGVDKFILKLFGD